jgi:hypothetical protein
MIDKFSNSTVLIQVGDMVDRGPGTTESKNCLRNLQATAKLFNSKVVRLLGSNNYYQNFHYNNICIFKSFIINKF